MKLLWLLLKAYFSPAVEGEDDDIDPPNDDDIDPPEDDDVDPPEDDDDVDPPPGPPDDEVDPPAPRLNRAQKAIIDARSRAQTAERELAEARAELALSRRAPPQPATPTAEQLLFQQEEETLRNPEATDWQRYAIQANRSARSANANSQNALQRAEDLADRTQFAALAATKPKLYSAYKDRVEDMLTGMRAKGSNVPREKLLAILIGEDMLSGKLKPSKGATEKPAAPRQQARSDVNSNSRGRMDEHEKRAKRLENIRI